MKITTLRFSIPSRCSSESRSLKNVQFGYTVIFTDTAKRRIHSSMDATQQQMVASFPGPSYVSCQEFSHKRPTYLASKTVVLRLSPIKWVRAEWSLGSSSQSLIHSLWKPHFTATTLEMRSHANFLKMTTSA
jgi:hypothetical protein